MQTFFMSGPAAVGRNGWLPLTAIEEAVAGRSRRTHKLDLLSAFLGHRLGGLRYPKAPSSMVKFLHDMRLI